MEAVQCGTNPASASLVGVLDEPMRKDRGDTIGKSQWFLLVLTLISRRPRNTQRFIVKSLCVPSPLSNIQKLENCLKCYFLTDGNVGTHWKGNFQKLAPARSQLLNVTFQCGKSWNGKVTFRCWSSDVVNIAPRGSTYMYVYIYTYIYIYIYDSCGHTDTKNLAKHIFLHKTRNH